MFSVSDTIVYPGYGVAKIFRYIVKEIDNKKVNFFELRFLNKDVTVLIPSDGIDIVGVRPLSDKIDVIKIFDIFCSPYSNDWLENVSLVSWNRRNKDYQNRIRKGNLLDLASIYKDIKFIEKTKGLSFGEKTVLSQVEFLISEECSIIEEKPIEAVCKEIKFCCEECLSGNSKQVFEFLSHKINNNLTLNA